MTRKNGAIGGLISGAIVYGFFKWFQLGGSFTVEQVTVVNTIFMITSLIFIGGFALGVIMLFKRKDVLGSTTVTYALLGFTSVFNGTTLVIALIQGDRLFSL